jgi:hypothetical protein
MNRSLPPFIVQLLGAAAFLIGLYLSLRGRPGAGQIMLVGAGLITTPYGIKAFKDRYATLPPPEDDELERYREERAAKRRREQRHRAERDDSDDFEWDERD